jgi:hypothetical protein
MFPESAKQGKDEGAKGGIKYVEIDQDSVLCESPQYRFPLWLLQRRTVSLSAELTGFGL